MKNKWIIILVGISAISIAGYFSFKKWLSRLKYGIKPAELKVKHIGFDFVEILLPVWVFNPLPISVIITKMSLNVSINNTFLGTVYSDNKYMIKSNLASEYPVLIKLPTSDLLKVLSEHGTAIDDPNWKSKVRLGVDGSVSAESGLMKVSNIKIKIDNTLNNLTA